AGKWSFAGQGAGRCVWIGQESTGPPGDGGRPGAADLFSPVRNPAGAKGTATMTHVVTEPCVDCKYTDCCVVCPVECFWSAQHDGKDMLVIDPEDCIDCEA